MKRLLSLAMLGMFSAAIVGCHAAAEVDGPDHNNDMDHMDHNDRDTSMKKTTTYDANGNVTHSEKSVNHD